MLAMSRSDRCVHQTELRKKEGEKSRTAFPRLGTSLLVRWLVHFSRRFVLDCPYVMYNKCPYASCRA